MSNTKVEISEKTHKKLKVYCAQMGLRMGSFVDSLVRERIDQDVDSGNSSSDSFKSQNDGNLQDNQH